MPPERRKGKGGKGCKLPAASAIPEAACFFYGGSEAGGVSRKGRKKKNKEEEKERYSYPVQKREQKQEGNRRAAGSWGQQFPRLLKYPQIISGEEKGKWSVETWFSAACLGGKEEEPR